MAKSRWMTETRGAKKSELSDDVKRLGKCLTLTHHQWVLLIPTTNTHTHIPVHTYFQPGSGLTDSFCFRTKRKSERKLTNTSIIALDHHYFIVQLCFSNTGEYHKITSETTHIQTITTTDLHQPLSIPSK